MTLTRFALPLVFLPGTALADISPQDVWDNLTSTYAAAGMTLEGAPAATSNGLQIDGAVIRVTYPIVGGSATLSFPAMTLTDQGDGTVAVETPATYVMEFAADIPDGSGLVTGNITIAQTGASSVASGDPADIIYTSSADTLDVLISDLSVPGSDFDFNMELDTEGFTSTTRITEGENLTILTDIVNGASTSKLSLNSEFMQQESTGTSGIIRTGSTIVLPPDLNILDLTPALMAGLSISLSSDSQGSTGTTVTQLDGLPTSEQSQFIGPSKATVEIDRDGMRATGTGDSIEFSFLDESLLTFPISGSAIDMRFDFAVPLVAQETPQDFKYAFGLSELALSEDLWGMFDPAQALDRSLTDINFDVSGSLNWGLNAFNIEELMALEDAQTSPITVNSVSINDFSLATLGAAAKAIGAFTFDNADTQTIPGMPRPEGTATVTASGLNAVIDQLVGAGFLQEEDVMMPRMMMGMFARTVGDDMLETVVEVNPEGHVIVNGQRMR